MSLTPESQNAGFGVWWIAATSIALGLGSDPVRAQFRGCDLENLRCIDDQIFAQCNERGTTVGSCLSLSVDLRAQQDLTPATAIGVTLGNTYYRLSKLAGDDAEEAQYLAMARQTLLDVVEADDASAEAYFSLSVVDSESTETISEWLRKGVAIDPRPEYIRRLVLSLSSEHTPEAYFEAIAIATASYAREAPGEDKWFFANPIHNTYQVASMRDPGISEVTAAGEFVSRVKRDSNWDGILQTLTDPMNEINSLRGALQTACQLIPIVGDEPCMKGIESTVQAALIDPVSADAQILADAAAYGIMEVPRDGSIVSPDTRRSQLVNWLDQLLSSQLDSLVVLDAVATKTRDLDRRLETRREIVARNPNSGRARLDLGIQLFNRDEWEAARNQFVLARELLAPDNRWQILIGQYIRQAEYEIRISN